MPSSPKPALPTGCFGTNRHEEKALADQNLGQADVLHDSPDDGQATGLRGEHINLIGALMNVAKETLDGVGGFDVAVHGLGSSRKRSRSCPPLRPNS